jgi:methylated-DNA-[protein]-cysteine S-methyltransferase
MMSTARACWISTPLGPLEIAEVGGRLVTLRFGEGPVVDPVRPTGVLADAAEQLAAYFDGRRRTFDLPLHPHGTPFDHQVWEVVRSIPYGSTTTYGDIARRLGDAGASRAIGHANARNPLPIVVPCHRVVGASGQLTGYAGGVHRKRALLQLEAAVAGAQPRLPFGSG